MIFFCIASSLINFLYFLSDEDLGSVYFLDSKLLVRLNNLVILAVNYMHDLQKKLFILQKRNMNKVCLIIPRIYSLSRSLLSHVILLGPDMAKFAIVLREIGTYKETLRSQVVASLFIIIIPHTITSN